MQNLSYEINKMLKKTTLIIFLTLYFPLSAHDLKNEIKSIAFCQRFFDQLLVPRTSKSCEACCVGLSVGMGTFTCPNLCHHYCKPLERVLPDFNEPAAKELKQKIGNLLRDGVLDGAAARAKLKGLSPSQILNLKQMLDVANDPDDVNRLIKLLSDTAWALLPNDEMSTILDSFLNGLSATADGLEANKADKATGCQSKTFDVAPLSDQNKDSSPLSPFEEEPDNTDNRATIKAATSRSKYVLPPFSEQNTQSTTQILAKLLKQLYPSTNRSNEQLLKIPSDELISMLGVLRNLQDTQTISPELAQSVYQLKPALMSYLWSTMTEERIADFYQVQLNRL